MGDYDGEERRREMKDATKQAIKEWLDEKFAQFYLILWANGWHK